MSSTPQVDKRPISPIFWEFCWPISVRFHVTWFHRFHRLHQLPTRLSPIIPPTLGSMFSQFYLHSLAKLLLDCLPISVNFSSIFYHFFTHFWSIFIQIFTNYWSISARFSTVFHQFLVNVTQFHQFLINFMSILSVFYQFLAIFCFIFPQFLFERFPFLVNFLWFFQTNFHRFNFGVSTNFSAELPWIFHQFFIDFLLKYSPIFLINFKPIEFSVNLSPIFGHFGQLIVGYFPISADFSTNFHPISADLFKLEIKPISACLRPNLTKIWPISEPFLTQIWRVFLSGISQFCKLVNPPPNLVQLDQLIGIFQNGGRSNCLLNFELFMSPFRFS